MGFSWGKHYAAGTVPMSIEGRVGNERERLSGMTPEERAWRKQWLKDQTLSHNEPRLPPNFYQERYNPIRRFYRYPLDTLFSKLESVLGTKTPYARYWTGKALIGIFSVYTIAYYFKYNAHDWTRLKGWRVIESKPAVYPGDPRFPFVTNKQSDDYVDHGFKSSPLYK